MEKILEEKLCSRLNSDDISIEPIDTGGSARQFFRVSAAGKSVILSITPDAGEFAYYTCFADFFLKNGISLPEFYECVPAYGAVIMEDLGNISLYEAIQNRLSAKPAAELYKSVLHELVRFQKTDVKDCPEMLSRPFDYDVLRWETDYFSQHIPGTFLNQPAMIGEGVAREFELLAGEVASQPVFPMHRDFQSQNIYIKDEKIYFIDFQGARMGPVFYDAASLINDPYVSLQKKDREELFEYYYRLLYDASLYRLPFASAGRDFLLASLQRIMQALGAYGNLGINKGKKKFLQYISPALAIINELLTESIDFPCLQGVVKEIITLNSRNVNLNVL